MSLSRIFFFAGMELLLCLIPGPAVLLVVSQAIRRGFRVSTRGAAGILTGNALYFALSAAGLGALLISIVVELPVLLLYGLAADRGRARYSRHAPLFERLAGTCLIAAGAKLAALRG